LKKKIKERFTFIIMYIDQMLKTVFGCCLLYPLGQNCREQLHSKGKLNPVMTEIILRHISEATWMDQLLNH
jgi:hypothetical protein